MNSIPTADSSSHLITGRFFRRRRGRVTFVEDTPTEPSATVRRPAKVARILALAHHVQRSIDSGAFSNQADVARKLGITRARITQLLDLLLLAPDIQEAILHLEAADGVEPLSERHLREIVKLASWTEQRALWP